MNRRTEILTVSSHSLLVYSKPLVYERVLNAYRNILELLTHVIPAQVILQVKIACSIQQIGLSLI